MAHNQITVDRLRLFGALKRSKKGFPNDIKVIDKILKEMRTDKESHYLSVSQDDINKVSYAKSKNDKYDIDKRIKTTFGRYIRRRLKIKEKELGDTTLSNLSSFIAVAVGKKKCIDVKVDKEENVKLLTGKDIVEFYADTDRSLHTCMTGKRKSYIISMYAMNPDKISLAVTKNKKARALVWIADDGTKVIDRIYPNNGKSYNEIKAWGQSQKMVSPRKTHKVTIKHNGYFPYMDTFKYGDIKCDDIERVKQSSEGTVTMSPDPSFGNAMFTNQSGAYIPLYKCHICDRRLSYYDRRTVVVGDKRISFCALCLKKSCTPCNTCGNSFIKDSESLSILENALLTKMAGKLQQCTNCSTVNNKKNLTCIVCNNICSTNTSLVLSEPYAAVARYYNRVICYDCINMENFKKTKSLTAQKKVPKKQRKEKIAW